MSLHDDADRLNRAWTRLLVLLGIGRIRKQIGTLIGRLTPTPSKIQR